MPRVFARGRTRDAHRSAAGSDSIRWPRTSRRCARPRFHLARGSGVRGNGQGTRVEPPRRRRRHARGCAWRAGASRGGSLGVAQDHGRRAVDERFGVTGTRGSVECAQVQLAGAESDGTPIAIDGDGGAATLYQLGIEVVAGPANRAGMAVPAFTTRSRSMLSRCCQRAASTVPPPILQGPASGPRRSSAGLERFRGCRLRAEGLWRLPLANVRPLRRTDGGLLVPRPIFQGHRRGSATRRSPADGPARSSSRGGSLESRRERLY